MHSIFDGVSGDDVRVVAMQVVFDVSSV
uniref:Uncharacterized protein n=1 Tax=Anguilla anguilla TaxID=7936 RepID=A0A0E9U9L5_ANGAN